MNGYGPWPNLSKKVPRMKNSKIFPPQSGTYKVDTHSGFQWQEFDTAYLGVSVGKEYHERDKLKACLDWMSVRFKNNHLLIADTLQRHNIEYEKGVSQDEAYKLSLEYGEEWLGRNKNILKDRNLEITRWDSLLNDPLFQSFYELANQAYETHIEFTHSIDSSIRNIWDRKFKDLSKDLFKKFHELSKNYLLEECAVISLAEHKKSGIVVYPGSLSVPKLVDLYNGSLKERHFLPISLIKNKAQKAA